MSERKRKRRKRKRRRRKRRRRRRRKKRKRKRKKMLTRLLVLYPAMMFMRVDLPAPLGPRIAVSSPDLNFPLTP